MTRTATRDSGVLTQKWLEEDEFGGSGSDAVLGALADYETKAVAAYRGVEGRPALMPWRLNSASLGGAAPTPSRPGGR